MPPPPEFRDAFGQIGVIEIFREMEAKHPPQADGHVGIPGKIEVNVQGKGNGIQPGEHHGRSRAFPIELYKHRQIVCQNDLFRKAHEKPPQTLPHSFPAVFPTVQLPGHVPVADDGAGNELGKQGNIGTEGNGIFLGRHRAPVHVHGVADTLKGIEADAHRQSQPQQGQRQSRGGIDADEKEVSILKKSQQPHADDNGYCQPRLFVGFASPDGKAAKIEYADGKNHQPQQFRLPPAVEKEAGKKQHGVFPPPGGEEIHRQHRREEVV